MGSSAAEWFHSPIGFLGVDSVALNRLLNYLLVAPGPDGFVRRLAEEQGFPRLDADFVKDVRHRAVANAKRRYREHEPEPFENERHVAAMANRFLRNAFFQLRHESTDVPTALHEPDTLATWDLRENDAGLSDLLERIPGESFSHLCSVLTDIAAAGAITCEHCSPSCYHHRTACPAQEVVLSLALQIVSYGEGAWPPIAALLASGGEPTAKALRYAMLETADPSVHIDDPIPEGTRQTAHRRWHCAEQLLRKAVRDG